MKRIGFVFFAAGLICLGAACASSGKAILLDQREPIALVSVVSNNDINWKDEEPVNPNNTGIFTRRSRRADPDMTLVSNAAELIVTAEKLFRDTIAGSDLIILAEKEPALGSRAYQEAVLNKYQINREELTPDAYRFIDYRDKDFPPALAAETGIQRSMFVEFDFTKVMVSGVGKSGSCQANVDMRVLILDAGGETLYRKTFSAWSGDFVKVSSGRYSHTELMSLFEPVIVDACYNFLDELEYY